MAKNLLIKGGCVLSMDRSVGNHTEADVLVENGVVAEIAKGLRARDAEVIDATDTIVMPGFVDTHRHAWRALFRNLGRGGAGESAVGPAIYGPHYQPDDAYAATLVGLLGAIEAGITTVVDWADIAQETTHIDAVLSAHTDSRVRTVFVHAAPVWAEDGANRTSLLDELASRDASPRTTLSFGSADPARFDLDGVAAAWSQARDRGLRIHTHAGRDPSEAGVIAELAERGLLGEDVTLVHCTHLNDADLDAIASAKTGVSLTPSNEMGSGLGVPPLQAFIDRGIRPGLGVGNEVEAPGDLFAQMRSANSVQHASLFDLKLAGKAGVPNLLSTRDVIRYGTFDGAAAVGLGEVTGSLTPGKSADVVVLRADRPNIAPINDPIGAVVWGMDTSNIDWVLVGGDVLVSEGRLTADVARAREMAVAAHGRVAGAAGLLATAGETP